MSKDAEVDMKDVELNDVDQERQPMTAGNGDANSALAVKNGIVKVKIPDEKESKFTGLSKEELLQVAGTPAYDYYKLFFPHCPLYFSFMFWFSFVMVQIIVTFFFFFFCVGGCGPDGCSSFFSGSVGLACSPVLLSSLYRRLGASHFLRLTGGIQGPCIRLEMLMHLQGLLALKVRECTK